MNNKNIKIFCETFQYVNSFRVDFMKTLVSTLVSKSFSIARANRKGELDIERNDFVPKTNFLILIKSF